jgi:hypothetical protein
VGGYVEGDIVVKGMTQEMLTIFDSTAIPVVHRASAGYGHVVCITTTLFSRTMKSNLYQSGLSYNLG